MIAPWAHGSMSRWLASILGGVALWQLPLDNSLLGEARMGDRPRVAKCV